MTTEYPLGPDDTHESLARDLLEQAANPDQVHWSPRPDVHGGGVYVLADSGIAERVREVRLARRAEEADRIAASIAAADARDADPDVASGLATPAEAGFAANTPAAVSGPDEAEETVDDAEGDGTDGEAKRTPAQKRAATKKAKQEAAAEADADAAADQENSE